MSKPIEESLEKLRLEYNNLCGNIGHLIVQNLHNDAECEKLKQDVLVVIKRTKSLNAQMKAAPVQEEEKQDVSQSEEAK